jgi:hypothetical protein
MSSAAIEVLSRPRTIIEPTVAGSGRGASSILPFFGAMQRTSTAIEPRPYFVSPRADQLDRIRALGDEQQLSVRTVEAKIEDVITTPDMGTAPLILTLDSPRAVAAALDATAETFVAILIYIFFQMQDGALIAMAAILTRQDTQLKRQLALFFHTVADVTVRSGSAAVFGEDAPAANIELEDFLRDWIGHHMATNLQKVIVDLEPNTAPIQVSRDGTTVMPFLVEVSTDGFKTIDALRTSVLGNLVAPLERGKDLVIAEVGPNAVRFHDARLRTDGSLVIRTRETNGLPDADRETAQITNPMTFSD